MKRSLLDATAGRILAATIGAILIALAGCATPGDILVGMDLPDVLYISPANGDGVQDTVSFPLTVDLPERVRLAHYEMTVITSEGDVVRRIQTDFEPAGFIARIRGESELPPEVVVWDGRDNDGEFVADGEYLVSVMVRDTKENTAQGAEQRVVVDNTYPSLTLAAETLLFTPNGDDRLEDLTIAQGESSVEDRWTGVIRAADDGGAERTPQTPGVAATPGGTPVRTYTWNGAASSFTWDGTADDGSPAPEGIYTYTVSATDRASNTATFTLDGIELERDPRTVSIFVSRTAFSPNGDGSEDTLALYASVPVLANLEGWEIQVLDVDGGYVRGYRGAEEPSGIGFDGLDDDGMVVPDGRYRAILRAEYAGGQAPQMSSPVFTVDTEPPRCEVGASELLFSPNGDGQLDTVDIQQTSSVEQTWTGAFRSASGGAVRTYSWNGQVENFTWDGKNQNGVVVPDGAYIYELTASDAAGNAVTARTAQIQVSTREAAAGILQDVPKISPNGDGLLDSVMLRLLADVTTGIDRWVVSIKDARGAEVGELATGTAIPASLEWDGMVGGSLVPDGTYYPAITIYYENGTAATALGSSVIVDLSGPEIVLGFTPAFFSPDGDDLNDELTISISAMDPSGVESWDATITDPDGRLFAEWSGAGRPPLILRWDGLSPDGELVESGWDYLVTVRATDTMQNPGSGETLVPIDILVTREGNRLRVSSIYFQPNTSSFENAEELEQAERNVETLDRLAEVLRRYPQYNIRIEGHATHLLSFDPLRAQTEHIQVLVPLSFARAEAIRQALVRRGIPESRMTIFGHGGLRPVVPHTDEENRWRNRRVEFFLERR